MESLILLRDAVESNDGKLIIEEAKNFMVVRSAGNANAEWIKGMGMLINHLMSIPEECKNKHNRSKYYND